MAPLRCRHKVLLASEPVRMAIAGEAARKGVSDGEAYERAQKFALEIASD